MTQTSKQFNHSEDIAIIMVNKIKNFNSGFQEYNIRELVNDTEKLGKELANNRLKTNQIRKFLDAVKRLKSNLDKNDKREFDVIKDDLILLQPKLAYAAARQRKNNRDLGPVAPFKQVLDAAILQVKTTKDFDRLVQLVEAIIAYHKAAGGEDQ
ncbi:MAG: type III-A CRISPR-associated protein Csm2 [Desmonostoc vinosum HA7617-LM4]|jgi:CRISPR-associated protein Csm2|nr:type III-A CRISPR-associated protein Csm2 [Desmonostoc vinosum HA7617-LM4]